MSRERARAAQIGQRHLAGELGFELDVDRVPARVVAQAVAIEVPVARIELRRIGVAGADDAGGARDRRGLGARVIEQTPSPTAISLRRKFRAW